MSDQARANAAYAVLRRSASADPLDSHSESPDIVYGRLLESAHISGYGFERMCDELYWLLDDDRWKRVTPGYDDIEAFLATIDLSPFNLSAQRRRPLVRRLNELKASGRATAKMLGASHTTMQRDLAPEPNGESAPPNGQAPSPDQGERESAGTYVPPVDNDPPPDQGERGDAVGNPMHGETRVVGDMLQDALGPEHAAESIESALKSAVLDLVDALAWCDGNANRAEYIKSLVDMHRDEREPLTAIIITAASWIQDESGGSS